MLIELKGCTLNIRPDHTEIMAHKPEVCSWCKRMACFFINRQGETRCTSCPSGSPSRQ